MNRYIHRQVLSYASGAAQCEAHRHPPADGNAAWLKLNSLDGHCRLLPVTEQAQCPWFTPFDGAAQCMFHECPALGRSALQPRFSRVCKERRMNLAEVIQVVGDTASDECRGIILEQLEKLEHPLRIVIQPRHPHRPGKAKTCTLGNESANVGIRIARPLAQHA